MLLVALDFPLSLTAVFLRAAFSYEGAIARMYGDSVLIQNLDALRTYVHETICNNNELEANVFATTERILVRRGFPCGIFFCLHGPRSVKLTAIWETDRNTILFYGSNGERLHKIHLTEAPSLQPLVA